MYQLTHAAAIVRLADGALIPANEANADYQSFQAWLADGGVPLLPEPESLGQVKAVTMADINAAYEAEFAAIKAQYPDAERESWPIQLGEAADLEEDPQADTPFLDALLVARGFGETKAELAAKVQAKNLAYSTLSARLTGKRHKLERQVMDAEALEQVSGVIW